MSFYSFVSKIKQNILLISVAVFGFFPLFPEKLKGLPVILFCLTSLFLFFSSSQNSLKINYKLLLLLSSLFLINLLSVFYTFSFVIPYKKIETSLSLLVVPIAFSLIDHHRFKPIHIKKIFFNVYILSTTILSLIFLFYYYYLGLFLDGTLKVNSFREATTAMPYFRDHPIYLSIFYGVSILFSLKFLINSKLKYYKKTIFYVISITIILINLILLSSKSVLISLLICSIFYLLISIKGKKKYYLIGFVLIGFLGLLLFSPTVERRFREFGIKTTYTEFHINNSSSIRIAIYKCTIEKIGEAPIFGYGWGESKRKLKDCFKDKYKYLYNGNYNSHNQYLSYYLNGGFFGLIVLLYFLFNSFVFSIKNKDYIYTILIIFYSIIMLTENVLERQSGLILFIFAISFLRFFSKEHDSY